MFVLLFKFRVKKKEYLYTDSETSKFHWNNLIFFSKIFWRFMLPVYHSQYLFSSDNAFCWCWWRKLFCSMYHVIERKLHVDTVVTENAISDQVFCHIAHESHGFWNEWVISYNFLIQNYCWYTYRFCISRHRPCEAKIKWAQHKPRQKFHRHIYCITRNTHCGFPSFLSWWHVVKTML